MARRAGLVVLIGVALAVVAVWGIARLPTAFIPNEDQGYLMIAAQLPDAASLGAHDRGPRQRDEIGARHPRGRAGDRDHRPLAARELRRPAECRRLLCHPQAVG